MKLPTLQPLSGYFLPSTAYPHPSTPSSSSSSMMPSSSITSHSPPIKRIPIRGDLPLPPVPPPTPPPSTITSTLTTTATSVSTLNITITVHTTKELFFTHNTTFYMPTYITSTETITQTQLATATTSPSASPTTLARIAPNLAIASSSSSTPTTASSAPAAPVGASQPEQQHNTLSTPAILALILGILALLGLLFAILFFFRRFYRMYRSERVARKRAVTEGNVMGDTAPGVAPARARAPASASEKQVTGGSAVGSGWISGVGLAGQESGATDAGGRREGMRPPPPAYVRRAEGELGGIEMGDLSGGDEKKGGEMEVTQTRLGERMVRREWPSRPSSVASWEK